jgi:hypothetical protein
MGLFYVLHVPLTQKAPTGHAFPQPPQFATSVSTSTQLPLQLFVSGPHTHCPIWQTAPVPHAFPHPPQFAGSVVVSVQRLPHTVWVVRHAHVPPAQT